MGVDEFAMPGLAGADRVTETCMEVRVVVLGAEYHRVCTQDLGIGEAGKGRERAVAPQNRAAAVGDIGRIGDIGQRGVQQGQPLLLYGGVE